MNKNNWFEVNREGLASVAKRNGKAFLLYELIQNAWDEDGVTEVTVEVTQDNKNKGTLIVRDNSKAGFQFLTHAYTLFDHSKKGVDPTKRGRFNLGEKLVIASCSTVDIVTTKGTIQFNKDGTRTFTEGSRSKKGTTFIGSLTITKEDKEELDRAAESLLVSEDILTVYNGRILHAKKFLGEIEVYLPTEVEKEGRLKAVMRKTKVRVYNPASTEDYPMVYEMGIPVAASDCKWHLNVQQKVPVSLDRASLSDSYLKRLHIELFNNFHEELEEEDMTQSWVNTAVSSKHCVKEAVEKYVDTRFGVDRASFVPTDKEANSLSVSKGIQVVHGNSMSRGVWENVRKFDLIQPTSKVTPSPKVWNGEDGETPFTDWIPEERWDTNMNEIAELSKKIAQITLRKEIMVRFCSTAKHLAAASYGPSCGLVFNKFRLGNGWFKQGITQEVVSLIIHELGHEREGNHLSEKYYEALCDIGAALYLHMVKVGKV